jgi:hypothetical protein
MRATLLSKTGPLRIANTGIRSFALVIGLAAVMSLAVSHPAAAKEGESFVCDIVPSGKVPEAFPEIVGVAVGNENEGTFVVDPIINYYYGGPIQADVVADNTSRLSIRWSVKVKNDKTGVAVITLFYELLILKANLTARLRLKARGDSLEFLATGTCERERP